jgi:hypothetical protein
MMLARFVLPHKQTILLFLLSPEFLEEQEMIEYKARKETSLLPLWVRECQKLEEGPLSLSEQQSNLLWNRISHLEEKLNIQALDFEASYSALQKEMALLQSTFDERKHLKRQDENQAKRKRADFDENVARNGSITITHYDDARVSDHRGNRDIDVGEVGRVAPIIGQRVTPGGSDELQRPGGTTPVDTVYTQADDHSLFYQGRMHFMDAYQEAGSDRRYY